MMKCEQVQNTLEDLTLPRLRAGKYTALRLHVQRCSNCQQRWNMWRRREEQLVALLTTTRARGDFWESVMAEVRKLDTMDTGAAIWRTVSLEVSPQGIQRLTLPRATQRDMDAGDPAPTRNSRTLLTRARTQLEEYFRGERAVFQLQVDLRQCSSFEREVLEATATIPYGEVRSYKWIAEQIGRPRAMRAVGNALHKNPVPIVVPCHRVVKSDGGIGGYAFGETWKTRLLTLEKDTSPFVGCSSTRILCYRGCHHERRIQEGNRIHFVDLSQALENGYRPCTACHPV